MRIPTTQTQCKSAELKDSASFVVVDKKTMGIWDVINLGNRGGIINLENGYGLEVVKTTQKWCEVHIIRYGIGGVLRKQEFVPIKKVENKEALHTLKQQLKDTTDNVHKLTAENARLQKELAKYTVSTTQTITYETIEL